MLYEIDQEFESLIATIDGSKHWFVTWACRLSTGYVIEMHNTKTGQDEEKFTTTFGEIEYWANELLNKKIA